MQEYTAEYIQLEIVYIVDSKIHVSTKSTDYQIINDLFIDYELFATILN